MQVLLIITPPDTPTGKWELVQAGEDGPEMVTTHSSFESAEATAEASAELINLIAGPGTCRIVK